MKTRIAAVVSAAATCAAAIGLTAPSASADLVTRCVGEGGAVTVPGDLVVPKGKSCVLTGTTVRGDVRVAPGANLIVENGTLRGRVSAADNAYVDTTGTTLGSRVALRPGGYGMYLDSSDVAGTVVARRGGESASEGFVYTVESAVAGTVRSSAGELVVDGGQIAGHVVANRATYADVYDSFVDGRLVVRNAGQGSVVCGSAIRANATYVGNSGTVQFGADGPVRSCASGSYVGGDVRIRGTDGEAYVNDSIINGDLVLRRNDPTAKVGSSNLIRGDIRGDYDNYDPASGMRTQDAPPERSDAVRDGAEQRRGQAVKEASAAGDADL